MLYYISINAGARLEKDSRKLRREGFVRVLRVGVIFQSKRGESNKVVVT